MRRGLKWTSVSGIAGINIINSISSINSINIPCRSYSGKICCLRWQVYQISSLERLHVLATAYYTGIQYRVGKRSAYTGRFTDPFAANTRPGFGDTLRMNTNTSIW